MWRTRNRKFIAETKFRPNFLVFCDKLDCQTVIATGGYITALFDPFCIVQWKRNRSKSAVICSCRQEGPFFLIFSSCVLMGFLPCITLLDCYARTFRNSLRTFTSRRNIFVWLRTKIMLSFPWPVAPLQIHHACKSLPNAESAYSSPFWTSIRLSRVTQFWSVTLPVLATLMNGFDIQ